MASAAIASKPFTVHLSRAIAVLGLALTLGGCYQVYVKAYGYASEDELDLDAGRQFIRMPANAPSIMNGFEPLAEHADDEDGHAALDIAGDVGLPILAAAQGTVVASYFEPMYGNQVLIRHGRNARGEMVHTRYLHLDRREVEQGQRVARGELIGRLGRTGALAIAIPHMHFELHIDRFNEDFVFRPVNPHLYWVDGKGRVTCFDRRRTYPGKVFQLTYPAPCRGIPWR